MAPFGQIIGLRQIISAESQNKNDDQLSIRSGLEEFLFLIGFLLLLMYFSIWFQVKIFLIKIIVSPLAI